MNRENLVTAVRLVRDGGTWPIEIIDYLGLALSQNFVRIPDIPGAPIALTRKGYALLRHYDKGTVQ